MCSCLGYTPEAVVAAEGAETVVVTAAMVQTVVMMVSTRRQLRASWSRRQVTRSTSLRHDPCTDPSHGHLVWAVSRG